MDKDKRKALQEQYKNRHPEMGIVCWRCGDRIWLAEYPDAEPMKPGKKWKQLKGQ